MTSRSTPRPLRCLLSLGVISLFFTGSDITIAVCDISGEAMTNGHREKARAARQRVVDALARFRADGSDDERLIALRAAIDNWHSMVGAWGKANTTKPTKENLS